MLNVGQNIIRAFIKKRIDVDIIGEETMAQARKKPVLKLVALEKTISTSIEALQSVCDSGSSAVAVRAKEKARLLAESKRLSKKKATLLKKKRTTSTKLKKAPSADLRKQLKAVEKELAMIGKNLEMLTLPNPSS